MNLIQRSQSSKGKVQAYQGDQMFGKGKPKRSELQEERSLERVNFKQRKLQMSKLQVQGSLRGLNSKQKQFLEEGTLGKV